MHTRKVSKTLKKGVCSTNSELFLLISNCKGSIFCLVKNLRICLDAKFKSIKQTSINFFVDGSKLKKVASGCLDFVTWGLAAAYAQVETKYGHLFVDKKKLAGSPTTYL